jgi:hypothetical protein
MVVMVHLAGGGTCAHGCSTGESSSRLKLSCNGLTLDWHVSLEQLDSLACLHEQIQERFALSACRLTYFDEADAEAALWADEDLVHFKAVARSRGSDATFVRMHLTDGGDGPARCYSDSQGNSDAAAAPAERPWTEEEEKRLVGLCRMSAWAGWGHIGTELGRSGLRCGQSGCGRRRMRHRRRTRMKGS